ncbi:MAG: hypothetical protein R3B84_17715 [Zavarzinella sp.]
MNTSCGLKVNTLFGETVTVRRRMAMSNRADDLIGNCQIVLIQAVAAYNPRIGIRFSTYDYTCLVRALARLAQKLSNDWLSKSASLDVMPEGEPRQSKEPGASSSIAVPIDDFLQADHPLLNQREKKILSLRYCNPEGGEVITLEKVGKQLTLLFSATGQHFAGTGKEPHFRVDYLGCLHFCNEIPAEISLVVESRLYFETNSAIGNFLKSLFSSSDKIP